MSAHYVYRCFDAHSGLIYVGASKDVAARMTQHGMSSFWAPQVAKVTARVFASKEIALDVERQTIEAEQPKYNIYGKKAGRSQWTEADCDAEITKLYVRGVGYSSRSAFERLFTEYLLRFGRTHRLASEIALHLDAFDVRADARRARQKSEEAQRRVEFELREAEEQKAHRENCCACRFGIVVDDEIVAKFGNEDARAELAGLGTVEVADGLSTTAVPA